MAVTPVMPNRLQGYLGDAFSICYVDGVRDESCQVLELSPGFLEHSGESLQRG